MTLIDRLSRLDGPDREVDILIGKLFPPEVIHSDGSWFEKDDIVRYPAVTASVDAAIALAERVLPEVEPCVRFGKNPTAWITYPDEWPAHLSHGATPAIALCIALLRAKDASKP